MAKNKNKYWAGLPGVPLLSENTCLARAKNTSHDARQLPGRAD